MIAPSMHLSRLLHHWKKPIVLEQEALPSPVHQNSHTNKPEQFLLQVWFQLTKKTTTCSNGGCGLPLQKFESVQVAFLSIESFACSFNCANKGSKAPWLRTRSRHLGESPATFPNAHTAWNFKDIVFRQARSKFQNKKCQHYHIHVSIYLLPNIITGRTK